MSQPSGTCPVCKKSFTKEDDIVICPSCGAPYHRACYTKAGNCVFSDKHGAGFEYQPEGKKADAEPAKSQTGDKAGTTGKNDAARDGEGIRCPNCGTINDGGNIFCEQCGTPLHQDFTAEPSWGGYGPGAGARGPVDTAGSIDEIPKKDWAAFVGPSAQTYLYRLSLQDQRKSKISFMASAFLVAPLYFAYRKMWGWAVATFVVLLGLSVPGYLAVFKDAGIPWFSSLSLGVLNQVSSATTWVSLGLQFVIGLFALYLYRRQAAKKMRTLKEKYPVAQEYRDMLAKKGGTSAMGVAVVLAAYVALYAVVYVNFGNYLYTYFGFM